MEEHGLKVQKPTPFWEKKVSFDSKAFFVAVGKFAAAGVTGRWGEALSEIPEGIAALGLGNDPGETAWVLIRRGLAKSILELFKEYSDKIPHGLAKESFNWCAADNEKPFEFSLTPDFFRDPSKSEVIKLVKPSFIGWLLALGVPSARAESMADRLKTYFPVALDREWRSNPKFYEEILGATVSPFSGAAEREIGWSRYRIHLLRHIDEPVFGESFSLGQVYVAPNAYITEKNKKKNSPDDDEFLLEAGKDEKTSKKVISVVDELRSWVKSRDKDFAVRVISGGPGSGKSSLAKILSCLLSNEDGQRVLLVPLHLIDVKADFVSAIGDFISHDGFLKDNPADPKEDYDNAVIILDGLDELEMQGRAAQEVSQQFVREVVRYVDRANNHACKIQIIISGRELAVQASESDLRKPGQIINLLPYYTLEIHRSVYEDPENLLAVDQRKIWWKKYGKLIGKEFQGPPQELTVGEIGEVTSQPLLNYLVALAYERGGIKISQDTNINDVYGDLVNAVHERGWSKNDHPAVRNISESSFVRLLEEVAISIWHGDGRTTTIKEIEAHCEKSRTGHLIPALEVGAKSGISNLLLAFYFRQKGSRKDGDKTFEFTHKSFGEYLTGLRVVRAIQGLSKSIRAIEEDPDYGLSIDDILFKWLELFGPTSMDRYLLSFVRREVALRESEWCESCQENLAKLYGWLLNRSWPMHRMNGLTFKEQVRWGRNAEETLIACINACALVTRNRTHIKWPSLTAFGESLKRLQGQRHGPENQLVHECLSYFDFSGCVLDMADLYAADLQHSNFTESAMHFVNLREAKLNYAVFDSVRMLCGNMEMAKFEETNFDKADLKSVRCDILDMAYRCSLNETFFTTLFVNEKLRKILQKKGARVELDDVYDDDNLDKRLGNVSVSRRRGRKIL
ncbi:pentapeptide repeat-containing protein [Azospirillum brasilense]|uniref:pentapeptide repeat-containing protein n=1 Tax=Azospirillum brasilense TaxID=192 RepID=UPI00157A667F|nr:pentapeptide repeat-containing protein [Azospirillum brasilense]